MKFQTETIEDILVLRIEGDLIGQDSGPALMELLNDKIESGLTSCAVNISGVRYMNSSGLGVLMTILTKFRNAEGEVALAGPSESVQKLLIITKLNSIFTIKPDERQAVDYLKSL
ncbi:hypothetical protein FUAX_26610 [Fulvitalea axinellae]|uniref:Anti-sigma factor antagonist n=1 Tax=Fulvitalea axinellae TaxID=1182444 RepID=A0AAU9CDK7_9BACT|nr:hypothetical protein FUAX_26610 [Fulvitalea axinellae]